MYVSNPGHNVGVMSSRARTCLLQVVTCLIDRFNTGALYLLHIVCPLQLIRLVVFTLVIVVLVVVFAVQVIVVVVTRIISRSRC